MHDRRHHCPIDVVDYGTDLFVRGLEHAGAEASSADISTGRQIAAEYLQALHDASQAMDMSLEQIERTVDSGRARLTRDLR